MPPGFHDPGTRAPAHGEDRTMTETENRNRLARRARGFGTTIFAEMTELAIRHQAVNLGQGFPNFPCQAFLKEAARKAVEGDLNQYARSAGLPRLVNVLAEELAGEFGRRLDPETEITVTSGATEGLFLSAQAFLEPGDEVVLIEPFYDAYPADSIICGARMRHVPLTPDSGGRWVLDFEELEKAFSPKTRMIFFNTPHNPTGKVFSREELERIAELCIRYDVIAVSDEVYDRMVFDGLMHVRLASLPGMWERTITLGSAGKTFSVTGWKIGWAVAPAALSTGLRLMHQWVSYAVATPLQEAVACALEEAGGLDYYTGLRDMYEKKRDLLCGALKESGFRVYVPQGTYFILADFQSWGFRDDMEFCRYLTTEVGVAAIPPGAFYSQPHRELARTLVRFCFCKTDETLTQAAEKLRAAYMGKQGERGDQSG
jgi:aspartate/methionine/tyrosine aminotransferase